MRYSQYPHEFSGGMRQRVVIAIAVACNPRILICDEPTTALDVTIQAQILELIRELQRKLGVTLVYITHDLGVVANVADRVAVMYAGEIIEYGTVEEIFYNPKHPYTWALLSSLPQLGEMCIRDRFWDRIWSGYVVFINAVPSAVYLLFIQLYITDLLKLPMLYDKGRVISCCLLYTSRCV